MTNTIYTIENVNKLTNEILAKIGGLDEKAARGMAEFALKYNANNEWPKF